MSVASTLNLRSIDSNSICLDYRDGDRGQDFSRILNNTDFDGKEVVYLGEEIQPAGLIYNDNNGEYEIEVHKFDFKNLYSINSYWQCGSCPHLFFILENGKQEYHRELLQNCSNKKGVDLFQVPKGISRVIIRELEGEITYLDNIYINDKKYFSGRILTRGQSLVFDVNPFDKIKLEGSYTPLSDTKPKLNDMWVRNTIIKLNNQMRISTCIC